MTTLREIRTDFPFTSRFVKVNGSNMHYVDEGSVARTFLLLHGQPTSVYLWRNIIPGSIQRRLRPEEVEAYEAPFRDPASRKPMWRWPREIPIAGEPADVHAAVLAYDEYLKTSAVPKLFLYATPGAASPPAMKPWVEANVRNVEIFDLGEGLHYLQEDHPHEIGGAIAQWAARKV